MSDFAADVEALRRNARTHLNATLESLTVATRNVVSTAKDDSAFDGDLYLFGAIAGQWRMTRDYMARVLDDNSVNVRLSRDALLEIADRYEEVDAASAAAINRAGLGETAP